MNFYEYPQCQEYSCIHTPYNDSTSYEIMTASDAVSLGTSAGMDGNANRGISAEFGGSAPHALSEYYMSYGFEYCMRHYTNTTNYGSWYEFSQPSTWASGVYCCKVNTTLLRRDGYWNCTQFWIYGCNTNGHNSGIASGAHKFSDFYSDYAGNTGRVVCLEITEINDMYTNVVYDKNGNARGAGWCTCFTVCCDCCEHYGNGSAGNSGIRAYPNSTSGSYYTVNVTYLDSQNNRICMLYCMCV